MSGEHALAFRYLDREIFPARKTDKEAREPRHSVDLLVANNNDNMLGLAELKIRRDKPAYFALIQIMMLAAEFQSPAQRERVAKYYPGKGLTWPAEGPFTDLYIIVFDPPKTGKVFDPPKTGKGNYRDRSFRATSRISERLLKDAGFAQYIRRIAYLEASVENDAMLFKKCFAFGTGL